MSLPLVGEERQPPAQPVDLAQVDLGDQEVLLEVRRPRQDLAAGAHEWLPPV